MDDHGVKTYRFNELYKHPRKPESSIISHGLLKEGAMMVVGGAPKTYKSFALNSIAVSLALGHNLFGSFHHPHGKSRGIEQVFIVSKPRRVLLFEQEVGIDDLEDRLAPWYESITIEEQEQFCQNFSSHSLDRDLAFDKAEGAARLEAIIREIKPEIVIFDPLIEFHTTDENSATSMGAVLKNFMRLCDRTGVTPILSHHEGKDGDNPRSGGDRLRGTSALYGKGDTFLNLTVVNRPAMRIKVEFTLRRGKPLRTMMARLNPETLMFEHLCWQGDKNWKRYANPVDEEKEPLEDMETGGFRQ